MHVHQTSLGERVQRLDSEERVTWRNPIIIITPQSSFKRSGERLESHPCPPTQTPLSGELTKLKHGQPGNKIHIVSKHSVGKMFHDFEDNSERMFEFLSKATERANRTFESALVVVDELMKGDITGDSNHTQLWNSVKSLNQYSSLLLLRQQRST